MTGTFCAMLPPVIAIVLALITKEVYLSLMIGIASGALMYHNFHLIIAMDTIFAIMGEKIGANCDILIFLVLLGILVALITKSGASRAYGKWAAKAIRTLYISLLFFNVTKLVRACFSSNLTKVTIIFYLIHPPFIFYPFQFFSNP